MYNICLYNEIPDKFYYDKEFLNNDLMISTTYDSCTLTEKKETGKIEEIQSDDNESINYIIRSTEDVKFNVEFFIAGESTLPENATMEGVIANDNILPKNAITEEHAAKDSYGSLGVIDKIYDFCYRSAYMYSWDYYVSNMCLKPYSSLIYSTEENYNKIKEAFYEIELLIKEQCLLVTLYTVQYLLNKECTISAGILSDIENMGYDYYKEHCIQTVKKVDTSTTSYRKINDVLKNIEKSRIDKQIDSYLGEVLNEMLDGTSSGTSNEINRKGKERLLPLFMCNFLFKSIDNYDKLKSDSLLNKIKNTNASNITRKKEAFVKNYVNCMNDFICYPEKSSLLDKVLFYYQKDQVFNCDLIISCFIGEKNNLPLIKNTNTELVKECMILQNIFFKTEIIKLFDYFEDNEDYFIKTPSEILKMLSNVIIPTFERTFFITLFDYIKENSKLTDKGTLEKMYEEIKNFIEMSKTPIIARILNNKIIDFNKDIKYNNKATEGKQNDRTLILYEILECFFKKRKEYNKTHDEEDIYYHSAKEFLFQLANNFLNKGL